MASRVNQTSFDRLRMILLIIEKAVHPDKLWYHQPFARKSIHLKVGKIYYAADAVILSKIRI
ncbi:MAG: hypothetical protein HQK97_06920 [Nitrospirae bacterium]|nr:hypothetical protein [Nitrospirota bacterium]